MLKSLPFADRHCVSVSLQKVVPAKACGGFLVASVMSTTSPLTRLLGTQKRISKMFSIGLRCPQLLPTFSSLRRHSRSSPSSLDCLRHRYLLERCHWTIHLSLWLRHAPAVFPLLLFGFLAPPERSVMFFRFLALLSLGYNVLQPITGHLALQLLSGLPWHPPLNVRHHRQLFSPVSLLSCPQRSNMLSLLRVPGITLGMETLTCSLPFPQCVGSSLVADVLMLAYQLDTNNLQAF